MKQQKQFFLAIILLTGLVPAFAQSGLDEFRFNVERFEIAGDNPLGKQAQKVLAPYVGEQFGLEGLAAAADALEQALIKAGYSFHRVSLPPQSLEGGMVKLEVIRFDIGAINVSGNQHFDADNIRHSLPQLQSGGTPNTKALSRSLKIANNHASKQIQLKFREGENGDAIDADIKVRDQNPQMVFISADNTGAKDSEEIRTTLGYQHGNLFNRDHAMTATLTVAPEDPDATTQIGISYHIPLYGHGGNLDFLLSDSEINSGSVANNNAITGQGSVFGFTYSRPLLTDSNFDHQWSIGFQYKNFDNEINNQPFSKVLSFPLDLGYGFTYRMPRGSISGGLNAVTNIDAGDNNDAAAYNIASNGRTSDNAWSAVRYRLAYDQLIGKSGWLIHAGLSGQQSDDLLISGEQFGVGGMSSLRGFEERSVTGDLGYRARLELWLPRLPANLRVLFFVDQANTELNASPGIAAVDYDLQSAGLGLRWSWKQRLSISLDYGKITDGLLPTEGVNAGALSPINLKDDDKAHFNLVYRF